MYISQEDYIMKFTTGTCKLCYVNVFAPRADLSGKERYSAAILIRKTDEKTLARYKECIRRMTEDEETVRKMGGKKALKNLKLPLHDGDTEREDDPNFKGCWYINAKANPDYPPLVLDLERNEITDKKEIYSGVYAQAVLSLYPYNQSGNQGIGAGLLAIRKVKDGKPISGASVSDADFKDEYLDNDDLGDIF